MPFRFPFIGQIEQFNLFLEIIICYLKHSELFNHLFFVSIHRGKMEQILLAYGLPKETVAAIMLLYRNTKVKVRSPDRDTDNFDIVARVQQRDTLAPYLFIICRDYVLRTSIDKLKENGFKLKKERSRRYPKQTITDADYTNDIALLANAPAQAETMLHIQKGAVAGICPHINAHKTEYICFNQTGNISTLNGSPLKLVDKFTYLGSSVSSIETDINTLLTKAWTAIDRVSVIWKSDLTDKMKRSFFQAAVVSILLYRCTTWTLTKRMEKKLDSNYTRILRAILNKSWRQHPTKQQLYGHLPPITKISKFDGPETRDIAGEVGTSSWGMYSCGPLHMDEQRQDVQLEPTYSSSVQIRDIALRICRKQWTIGMCVERRSGISVLIAWHDDDDEYTWNLLTVSKNDWY